MDELELIGGDDFAIGPYHLFKHFGLKDMVPVLSQPGGEFGKQLALKTPSEFPSGRVPIYLCPCGDLACGAVTVSIEEDGGTIVWSEFGRESNWESGIWQDEYMRRTGPFRFDRKAYLYTLSAFF